MNLGMLIISLLVFVMMSRLAYEIWFLPIKYMSRLEEQRRFLNVLFGISYWKEGHVNWLVVKISCIFLLILSVIGIVVSFTGPLNY
jgi:uncharacterized membrane protein YfcA